MAVPAAPMIREGPQAQFVPNLFFKIFPDIRLNSSVQGLIERSTQCLECSNKFGAVIVSGQESLLIFRVDDILAVQSKARGGGDGNHIELNIVPHIKVLNSSFDSPPCVLSISNGEEFIAIDTQRNGAPIVLIFKLEQFLLQAGGSVPHCEIRASMQGGSRVSGISWNPGENMNNIVAINCDDGSLQLATIKGEKSVEMHSFKDGGVKSMCWSPKGKQLVVGKINGNLSQLKLDLTEAKQIPGPGQGRIPTAIFWTSTTQFLITFTVQNMDIDFMQLDLIKGAPPTYSSYGDIFVSDKVSSSSKSFFVPILPWNVILCPSNTINDIQVLMKGLDAGNKENWTLAEVDDNRRGAIPIDTFAVGAALYTGCDKPIVFSDVEAFGPMPYIFVLSNNGVLLCATVVNSLPNVPSVVQKVPNPLRPDLFIGQQQQQQQQQEISSAPQSQIQIAPTPLAVPASSQLSSLLSGIGNPQTQSPNQNIFQAPPNVNISSGFTPGLASSFTRPQLPIQNNEAQYDEIRSILQAQNLAQSQLPGLQQVEEAKRVVEERREQVNVDSPKSQDQNYVSEEDYTKLALELEKFHKRLETFRSKQLGIRSQIEARMEEIMAKFEQEVLAGLNILEDFVSAVQETTVGQKEEVNLLTEKVMSHFTELEYARSISERNKDPRYLQLLRSQPLDSATTKRFMAIEKLFNYVKNQVHECDRFLKIQNQDIRPLSGSAAVQSIYQTLSNHSLIIKRLVQNLNGMRTQAGLSKCHDLNEEMEVFEPTKSLGYGYFEKRPMLKAKQCDMNYTSSCHKNNKQNTMAHSDRITWDELTAGLSQVKLRQEGRGFLERKSLKISAKKLEVLTKAISKTVEINAEYNYDQPSWMNPVDQSKKFEARRKLISQLDDKTLPPALMEKELISQGKTSTTGRTNLAVTSTQQTKQPTTPLSQSPNPSVSSSQQPQIKSIQSVTPSSSSGSPSQNAPSPQQQPQTKPIQSVTPSSGSPNQSFGKTPISFGLTNFPTSKSTLDGIDGSSGNTNILGSSQLAALLATPSVSYTVKSPVPVAEADAGKSKFSGSLASTASNGVQFGSSSGFSFGGIGLFELGGNSSFAKNPSTPSTISTSSTTTVASSVSSSATLTSSSSLFGNLAMTISTTQPSLFGSGLGFVGIKTSQPSLFGPGPSEFAPSSGTNLFSTTGAPTASSNAPASITSTTSSSILGNFVATTSTSQSPSFSLFGAGVGAIGIKSSQPSIFEIPTSTEFAPSLNTSLLSTTVSATTSTVASIVTSPTSSLSLLGNLPTTTTTISSQSNLFRIGTTGFGVEVENVKTSQSNKTSLFGAGPSELTLSSGSSLYATTASISPVTSPTTPSSTSLFGNLPTPTSSNSILQSKPSLFGAGLEVGGIKTSQPSLFGAPPPSTGFSSSPSPGLFGTAVSTVTPLVLNLTSPTTSTTSSPSLFGSLATPPATLVAPQSNLFGSGIGSVKTTQSSLFGAPTTEFASSPSSGLFGTPPVSTTVAAIPPQSNFGSPSVFGGTPAFGSSPFGSPAPFGSTPSTTAFGSPAQPAATGGSVFGGSTFGNAATSPDNIFGASAFGGLGTKPSTDAASSNIFGGSSTFGSNVNQNLFAGQNPSQVANSTGTGLFSGGSLGVAQSGFSFSTPTKPAATGGFGGASVFGATALPQSTGFGSPAVFGGAPAFGSTSPFGSAFGSSPVASSPAPSAFGGGSGSGGLIFGGGSTVVNDAPTFGALAQTAQPQQQQQGFGSFGSSVQPTSPFGGQPQGSLFGQPPQQQTSPFGGGAPAQKSGASFGGSAFSSWR